MSGWTLAEWRDEAGDPFMVRTRAALPAADGRARLPVAVWLSWPWGPIASEAEEDAILDAMIAFENALHAACEAGGWGMLIAVVTNGAGRDWLFHAADGQVFRDELAGVVAGERWPALEVRTTDDPAWNAARELNPRAAMH